VPGQYFFYTVSILRPFYEFIYPPTCFGCERRLGDGERKVCTACWASIRRISHEDPLYQEMLKKFAADGHIAGLVSAFHFEREGVLQSLLHQLKYDGMTSLGIELGKRLGESVHLLPGSLPVSSIVPVPLHPTKKRERGYNQSECICKGMSSVTGMPVLPSLLERKKYTRSQTQLNAEERKENMSNAFAVHSTWLSSIRDQTFLLVDDVITTGSTMEACAHVLMQNGAKGVIACSVALAEHSTAP
jgi:ComF family protein